ncbi:hypothetical protein J3L18_25030 [Mucilaginibacter gossypii]|nr:MULTISPECIES: hypothetical protein [Mucilaginibacter]QTE36364.1 hypothetical protein J3L18_25030 [Mucilaginibacter gossypii]
MNNYFIPEIDAPRLYVDKTHENDPIRPAQKDPFCQLKVTTFTKAK